MKTAADYLASWDRGLAKALTGVVDQQSLEEAQCLMVLFEEIFLAGAEAQREADADLAYAKRFDGDCPCARNIRNVALVTLPKGEG